MESSNSPPKIKELGFLELEITTILLYLLGCPLECGPLCFESLMEDSRKGFINEGDTSLQILFPVFLKFWLPFAHKFLDFVQN